MMTTALFGVPQVGVNVDQAKVLTQQVALSSVYQTLQTFMGGRWSTTSIALAGNGRSMCKPKARIEPQRENLGKFYVTNKTGDMVPLSTLTSIDARAVDPEFIMKYNLFQCVQINGSAAPGYSSGQAIAALEDVFKKTMPPQMGFDYMGMSYQEVQGRAGR